MRADASWHGKISEVGYHPPFDLFFSSGEFKCGDSDLNPEKWTALVTIWP